MLTWHLKACDLIRRSLKKVPLPLSEPLWNILRRFSLIRTPDEQRIYLFRNSPLSTKIFTSFSRNIFRSLLASFAIHPRTRLIQLLPVQGGGSGIDLLFSKEEARLRIHEKWFDFDKIHETAPCQVSHLVATYGLRLEGFSCDHIVEELFELDLSEITE